jgi:hypothetical protein
MVAPNDKKLRLKTTECTLGCQFQFAFRSDASPVMTIDFSVAAETPIFCRFQFERWECESPLPFPPPSKEVFLLGLNGYLYKRHPPQKVAFILNPRSSEQNCTHPSVFSSFRLNLFVSAVTMFEQGGELIYIKQKMIGPAKINFFADEHRLLRSQIE